MEEIRDIAVAPPHGGRRTCLATAVRTGTRSSRGQSLEIESAYPPLGPVDQLGLRVVGELHVGGPEEQLGLTLAECQVAFVEFEEAPPDAQTRCERSRDSAADND